MLLIRHGRRRACPCEGAGACRLGYSTSVPKASQPAVSRVEERRGAAIAVRLPSPLIKPDVRISRIRLSDWLRGRLTSWRWGLGTCAVAARPEGRILLPC